MNSPTCYYCNDLIWVPPDATKRLLQKLAAKFPCRSCGVDYQAYYYGNEWRLSQIQVPIQQYRLDIPIFYLKDDSVAMLYSHTKIDKENTFSKYIMQIPIKYIMHLPVEKLQTKILNLLPFL